VLMYLMKRVFEHMFAHHFNRLTPLKDLQLRTRHEDESVHLMWSEANS